MHDLVTIFKLQMMFPSEGWNDIYNKICEDMEDTDHGIFQGITVTFGRSQYSRGLRHELSSLARALE
jgi:hypothetical protein